MSGQSPVSDILGLGKATEDELRCPHCRRWHLVYRVSTAHRRHGRHAQHAVLRLPRFAVFRGVGRHGVIIRRALALGTHREEGL